MGRERTFRETSGQTTFDAMTELHPIIDALNEDGLKRLIIAGKSILEQQREQQDDDEFLEQAEKDANLEQHESDEDRVRAYLHQLNLDGKLNSFTSSLHEQLQRRGSLSDRQVAAVMRDIEKADRRRASERGGAPAVTQPGVYKMDGVIYVVKPNKEKTGLYAKRIRELNSTRLTEAGTVVEIEFDYMPGAVYDLKPEHKMPLDEAKQYTIRYGRCIVCGRELKKAESVERGIGPICAGYFG